MRAVLTNPQAGGDLVILTSLLQRYMVGLAMTWVPNDWRLVVQSARWTRAERVHGARFRCGVCRNDFIPRPDGADTFIDQHYSMRLTVCPICASTLDRQKPLGE